MKDILITCLKCGFVWQAGQAEKAKAQLAQADGKRRGGCLFQVLLAACILTASLLFRAAQADMPSGGFGHLAAAEKSHFPDGSP